jgi:hypothetical protein
MDSGLISDTQVYSLFTEYTSVVKVVVGALMALVAYLFNRDCENMLILLFITFFAFFFSITYILLFVIFNIFGFKNICYYDPYSKGRKLFRSGKEGFLCGFWKTCGDPLNNEIEGVLKSPSNNSNFVNGEQLYKQEYVGGPIIEINRKNNSGSLTNDYNNNRCSWGAIRRLWNYGMDFSKCDDYNNNNNNNNNFGNRKKNNKSRKSPKNKSSVSKYNSAKESLSVKKTPSSKYYSAKLKQTPS